jgi:hypothetical protein
VDKADLVLDDAERASIWRHVGEVRRDMLDERDSAINAYERAAWSSRVRTTPISSTSF